MTDTSVVVMAAVAVVYAALLIALLRDRVQMKARRDIAEGRIAGLALDLEATREQLVQVQHYLAQPDSWQVDPPTVAPAQLRDPGPPDRWTAPHGASRPDESGTDESVADAAGSDAPGSQR